MRAPAIRRFANPLSIWIAMLAIVLQSVMPMAAQARLRMMAPTAAASADAMTQAPSHACDETLGVGHAGNLDGAPRHDATMPAGSHATHAPDATQTAVTTATPAHPGDLADSSPAPVNPHAMHGDAPCPYCRVHLDVVALPPVPNPHWVLLVAVVPRPITDEAIPVTADPWSPTRQRGPPPIA